MPSGCPAPRVFRHRAAPWERVQAETRRVRRAGITWETWRRHHTSQIMHARRCDWQPRRHHARRRATGRRRRRRGARTRRTRRRAAAGNECAAGEDAREARPWDQGGRGDRGERRDPRVPGRGTVEGLRSGGRVQSCGAHVRASSRVRCTYASSVDSCGWAERGGCAGREAGSAGGGQGTRRRGSHVRKKETRGTQRTVTIVEREVFCVESFAAAAAWLLWSRADAHWIGRRIRKSATSLGEAAERPLAEP